MGVERAVKNFVLIFVMSLMLSIAGCNDDHGPVKRSWGEMKGLNELVGNMNDISYSHVRLKPRLNALEKSVAMHDFEGQFVWSEYVSPLCKAAREQTQETKKVKSAMGDQVIFLTIMTANSHNYYDHATVSTARKWSDQFHLDPERVLAAALWYKTVPEHRFFSPQGHTLFVHVGYLSASQIMDTISYYKTTWNKWHQTGEPAVWMKFN